MVNRFDIFLVGLDPTIGREIRKRRPCVVVSADEMNHRSEMVIIAPLTSRRRSYPTRVDCRFKNRFGQIALTKFVRSIRIALSKDLGWLIA